jgi:hypothetical protein
MDYPAERADAGMVKFKVFRVHRSEEIIAVNLNAFGGAQLTIVGTSDF